MKIFLASLSYISRMEKKKEEPINIVLCIWNKLLWSEERNFFSFKTASLIVAFPPSFNHIFIFKEN